MSIFPVTWQRWQSHQSIRRSQKPYASRKLHSSVFDRTRIIAAWSFICGNWEFCAFCATVTLTLNRWPSHTNLTPIPEDVPAATKWTFYVSAIEDYRITDRQTDRPTTLTRRFTGGINRPIYKNVYSAVIIITKSLSCSPSLTDECKQSQAASDPQTKLMDLAVSLPVGCYYWPPTKQRGI